MNTAGLQADLERLASLVDGQAAGGMTVPERRDMEALGRILAALPGMVTELATAIRGALTLPQPATTDDDDARYGVMRQRVACVLGNLDVLAGRPLETETFQAVLARLARVRDDLPVRYRVCGDDPAVPDPPR